MSSSHIYDCFYQSSFTFLIHSFYLTQRLFKRRTANSIPFSFNAWKTIRKEQAHVLERKSTGADRGPSGAEDWSKKWMGRILQGCSRGIRNTTQSLEVAQGEEKGASKVDKCCQNEIELVTSFFIFAKQAISPQLHVLVFLHLHQMKIHT